MRKSTHLNDGICNTRKQRLRASIQPDGDQQRDKANVWFFVLDGHTGKSLLTHNHPTDKHKANPEHNSGA